MDEFIDGDYQIMSRSILLLFQVSDWCSYFCPDWIISTVVRRLVTVFISTLCNAKTTLQILSRLLYFWARLEICYFCVSQHKSTHTQSTGWQTNPDTNCNSKNIWHWLTGKSFEERGDMLLLWKPGKSENRKKQLRLTLASSRKIFFSCEEPALEVLMSVCPRVINLKF